MQKLWGIVPFPSYFFQPLTPPGHCVMCNPHHSMALDRQKYGQTHRLYSDIDWTLCNKFLNNHNENNAHWILRGFTFFEKIISFAHSIMLLNMNALQWMGINEMRSVWTLPLRLGLKIDPALPTKEDLLSLMHILSATIKLVEVHGAWCKNPRRYLWRNTLR